MKATCSCICKKWVNIWKVKSKNSHIWLTMKQPSCWHVKSRDINLIVQLQLQHSSGFVQRFVTTVYEIVTDQYLQVLPLPNRSPYPRAECTKPVENCYINTRETSGRYILRINTTTSTWCKWTACSTTVQWICARTAASPAEIRKPICRGSWTRQGWIDVIYIFCCTN